MQELKETNYALGDRSRLLRILDEQGYWFFRGVLDPEALETVRQHFMAELHSRDLVKQGSDDAVWNRTTPITIDDGVTSSRYPRMRDARVWETFVEHPEIVRFFSTLAGETPEWLTTSDYYRIVPPGQDAGEDPFELRHQDGLGLPGLDFATCWIPLADVDPDVGGLAIVPGSHKGGIDRNRWFTPEHMSSDQWARADYAVGDVLMFPSAILHSGLRNRSIDKFRMSLDIRLYMRGSSRPAVGPVTAITADEVVIDAGGDAPISLKLTDETMILLLSGDNEIPQMHTRQQVADVLPLGKQVMAVGKEGKALILRPAHSAGY